MSDDTPTGRTRRSSPIFRAIDRSVAPMHKQLDANSAKLDYIAAALARQELRNALLEDRVQRLEDAEVRHGAAIEKFKIERGWVLGAACVLGAIASWLVKKFGG